MIQEYVVGYLFSKDLSCVCLLKKDRGPSSLHGKLTGPGGKIELGESTLEAMEREFSQETGVVDVAWYKFAELEISNNTRIHFFRARSDRIFGVKSMESEEVKICYISELPFLDLVEDGRWLITLAMFLFKDKFVTKIEITREK